MYDSEQVVATQACQHFRLVGSHGGGIAAEDEQHLDRWAGQFARECFGQLHHIDRASPRRRQIGALQPRHIQRKATAGGQQHAARSFPPTAEHRRQTCHRANCHAAAAMPLHAVVDANHTRPNRGQFRREPLDCRRVQTGDSTDAIEPVIRHDSFAKLLGPDAVVSQVVFIGKSVSEEHMHQTQRQCRVGADFGHDVPIAAFGRAAAVGIDAHDPSPALASVHHLDPQVHVGDGRVGSPIDDITAVRHGFGIRALSRSDRVGEPRHAGGRTDRAI